MSSPMDQYEVLKPIGKGKFAIVYRAQRRSDGELVAVKKVTVDMMDQKARDKCLKEVRLLQSLDHPNIIKYLDSFLDGPDLVIVVEWAAAGDLKRQLRKALEKRIRFEERVIWKYFSQICEAIRHMHERRILHRDLKPANIFLTVNGVVKVGDLGLGRAMSEQTIEAHSKVGTPLYMSPEVLRGDGYDWKSDIWSLGCLLYELAQLRSPFKAEGLNLYSLFQKISQGDYAPLPEVYSHELHELAYAMIATDAAQRPDIGTACRIANEMRAKTSTQVLRVPVSKPLPSPAPPSQASVNANHQGFYQPAEQNHEPGEPKAPFVAVMNGQHHESQPQDHYPHAQIPYISNQEEDAAAAHRPSHPETECDQKQYPPPPVFSSSSSSIAAALKAMDTQDLAAPVVRSNNGVEMDDALGREGEGEGQGKEPELEQQQEGGNGRRLSTRGPEVDEEEEEEEDNSRASIDGKNLSGNMPNSAQRSSNSLHWPLLQQEALRVPHSVLISEPLRDQEERRRRREQHQYFDKEKEEVKKGFLPSRLTKASPSSIQGKLHHQQVLSPREERETEGKVLVPQNGRVSTTSSNSSSAATIYSPVERKRGPVLIKKGRIRGGTHHDGLIPKPGGGASPRRLRSSSSSAAASLSHRQPAGAVGGGGGGAPVAEMMGEALNLMEAAWEMLLILGCPCCFSTKQAIREGEKQRAGGGLVNLTRTMFALEPTGDRPTRRGSMAGQGVSRNQQFWDLVITVRWLFKEGGIAEEHPSSASVIQCFWENNDAPLTIATSILTACQACGYQDPTGPSVTPLALSRGWGWAVCHLLHWLAKRALELGTHQQMMEGGLRHRLQTRLVYRDEKEGAALTAEGTKIDETVADEEGDDGVADHDPEQHSDVEDDNDGTSPALIVEPPLIKLEASQGSQIGFRQEEMALWPLSKIDPVLWRAEMERISSRLPSFVGRQRRKELGEMEYGTGWPGHLTAIHDCVKKLQGETGQQHQEEKLLRSRTSGFSSVFKEAPLFPASTVSSATAGAVVLPVSTCRALLSLSEALRGDIQALGAGEKRLGSTALLKQQAEEYAQKKKDLQSLEHQINRRLQNVRQASQRLAELVDHLDHVQTKIEGITANLSSSRPLLELREAMARIKAENMAMGRTEGLLWARLQKARKLQADRERREVYSRCSTGRGGKSPFAFSLDGLLNADGGHWEEEDDDELAGDEGTIRKSPSLQTMPLTLRRIGSDGGSSGSGRR